MIKSSVDGRIEDTGPLTRKRMETVDEETLTGAARVLGETFSMNIAEVSKTGGFELAREQIASQRRKSTEADWTIYVPFMRRGLAEINEKWIKHSSQ